MSTTAQRYQARAAKAVVAVVEPESALHLLARSAVELTKQQTKKREFDIRRAVEAALKAAEDETESEDDEPAVRVKKAKKRAVDGVLLAVAPFLA
jgi:hypothetical protein